MCFGEQLLRNMWPIHLAFLCFTAIRMFFLPWFYVLFLHCSIKFIYSVLLKHISKLSTHFWSIFPSVGPRQWTNDEKTETYDHAIRTVLLFPIMFLFSTTWAKTFFTPCWVVNQPTSVKWKIRRYRKLRCRFTAPKLWLHTAIFDEIITALMK
jgi:hypothetical protein